MFASYGYPHHCGGSPYGGRCGGGGFVRQHFGLFPPSYDEVYAHEQHRRRQEELVRQERARQLRAREAAYLREVAHRQREQEAYERAVHMEHARRQRAAREDPLVEIVFEDGSRRVAPLSWVRRMQQHARERSPSPPAEHDTVLETPASNSGPHDIVIESKSQETPNHARLSSNEAATTLQRYIRRHLRLKQLALLRHSFASLSDSFATSSAARDPSALVFSQSPSEPSDRTPSLAFNTAANKELQMYEEELIRLLTRLDSIESGGFDAVKKARKALVVEIEAALSGLDRLKATGWETQRQAALASVSAPSNVDPSVEESVSASSQEATSIVERYEVEAGEDSVDIPMKEITEVDEVEGAKPAETPAGVVTPASPQEHSHLPGPAESHIVSDASDANLETKGVILRAIDESDPVSIMQPESDSSNGQPPIADASSMAHSDHTAVSHAETENDAEEAAWEWVDDDSDGEDDMEGVVLGGRQIERT